MASLRSCRLVLSASIVSLLLSMVGHAVAALGGRYTEYGSACTPLVHYTFDDDILGVVVDSSGEGNHGSLHGASPVSPGVFGKAYQFDGIDDFIACGNLVQDLTNFTISCWVNIASYTDTSYMGPWSQQQFVYPPTRPRFMLYTSPGSNGFGTHGQWADGSLLNTRTNAAIGLGEWHLVTQTYDGSNVRQYIDTNVVNAVANQGKTLGSSDEFLIGKTAGYPASYLRTACFHGMIDDFRICRSALSTAEITGLYAAGVAAMATNPPVVPPATAVHLVRDRTALSSTELKYHVAMLAGGPVDLVDVGDFANGDVDFGSYNAIACFTTGDHSVADAFTPQLSAAIMAAVSNGTHLIGDVEAGPTRLLEEAGYVHGSMSGVHVPAVADSYVDTATPANDALFKGVVVFDGDPREYSVAYWRTVDADSLRYRSQAGVAYPARYFTDSILIPAAGRLSKGFGAFTYITDIADRDWFWIAGKGRIVLLGNTYYTPNEEMGPVMEQVLANIPKLSPFESWDSDGDGTPDWMEWNLGGSVTGLPPVVTSIPVYGTGLDEDGSPLPAGGRDGHYSVVSAPVGTETPPFDAYVVHTNGVPFGSWVTNDAKSQWVSDRMEFPDTVPGSPAGTYVYRTCFDLSDRRVETATLSLRLLCDNAMNAVRLNGAATGITVPAEDGYAAWQGPYVLTNGFVEGTNVLEFDVVQTPGAETGDPHGLRTEITGTAMPKTPFVQLTVLGCPTAHGSPEPFGYGTRFTPTGGVVTNRVDSPVMLAPGRRARCVGWVGTGSLPGEGGGTIVVCRISTNSTLTWLWQEEVLLQTHAVGPGQVEPDQAWCMEGDVLTVTASAWNGAHFVYWEQGANGADRLESSVLVTVDAPRTLTARFADDREFYGIATCGSPYYYPGANKITCRANLPTLENVWQLIWKPTVPAAWSVIRCEGDGAPEWDGASIVFVGSPQRNPVEFAYWVRVPAGESGPKSLSGLVTYQGAGMANPTNTASLPDPVVLVNRTNGFHDADYQDARWVIDGAEASRVLSYWRAGWYAPNPAGYDGFSPCSSNPALPAAGLHSADYAPPYWRIKAQEANRVLAYWRAGGYHADEGGEDGYAAAEGGVAGTSSKGLVESHQSVNVLGVPGGYDPGGTWNVTNVFSYAPGALGLALLPELPSGWRVVGVQAAGLPELRNGEVLWTTTVPVSPLTVVLQIQVPATSYGTQAASLIFECIAEGRCNADVTDYPTGPIPMSATDADADGLPDAWESLYDDGGTSLNPTDDLDLDGMINLHECVAGTDPLDWTSKLVVTCESSTGSNVLLCWSSATGRVYRVLCATNLLDGFTPCGPDLPATPPINTAAGAATSTRFYRIGVVED